MTSEIHNRVKQLNYDFDSRPKEFVESCNLCGGRAKTRLTHQDRYGFRSAAEICDSCGLTFLNPRLTAEAYRTFYSAVYRPLVSAYHNRRIDFETVQQDQAPYALALSSYLSRWVPEIGGRSLLDIGGSTGVVSSRLAADYGFDPLVLDPSPEELAVAKSRGCRVQSGLLEDLTPEGSFSLILLCQTVDHLLDVAGALKKIKSVLRPDGMFFVDIVDFRWSYLHHRSIESAIKVDHPYYLVPETMEFYLRIAGFKAVGRVVAADSMHLGYLCRHSESEIISAEELAETARFYFREIRRIQAER
jgi:SAM-dependent methyltransferase